MESDIFSFVLDEASSDVSVATVTHRTTDCFYVAFKV